MTHPNYYAGVPLVRDDSLRQDAQELARLRADPLSQALALWRDMHQVAGVIRPQSGILVNPLKNCCLTARTGSSLVYVKEMPISL